MNDPNKEEINEKIKIIRQQRRNERLHFLKNQIIGFVVGSRYTTKDYEDL